MFFNKNADLKAEFNTYISIHFNDEFIFNVINEDILEQEFSIRNNEIETLIRQIKLILKVNKI